ncbi:MAG TPA: lamin tail domain-containing protein, partial [Longimicrobium sp.]
MSPTPRADFNVTGSALPPLVITEVMADPSKVADGSGEWFEVYNGGTVPVDLNGWRIKSGPTGSETHTINTSVVVPARGFVVLGNNLNTGTNGGVNQAYSYAGAITLNNSNTDWLVLSTPTGTLVDSVSY